MGARLHLTINSVSQLGLGQDIFAQDFATRLRSGLVDIILSIIMVVLPGFEAVEGLKSACFSMAKICPQSLEPSPLFLLTGVMW
jgi:hypothetical protein